jgi:hypothetical protein
MKAIEADVLWVPTYSKTANAGDICVRQHLTHCRQQYPHHSWMSVTRALTLGGLRSAPTKGSPVKQLLSMFILFNTLTVRDGIDVKRAHEAFLAIDEYRQTISPDAPGACQ